MPCRQQRKEGFITTVLFRKTSTVDSFLAKQFGIYSRSILSHLKLFRINRETSIQTYSIRHSQNSRTQVKSNAEESGFLRHSMSRMSIAFLYSEESEFWNEIDIIVVLASWKQSKFRKISTETMLQTVLRSFFIWDWLICGLPVIHLGSLLWCCCTAPDGTRPEHFLVGVQDWIRALRVLGNIRGTEPSKEEADCFHEF